MKTEDYPVSLTQKYSTSASCTHFYLQKTLNVNFFYALLSKFFTLLARIA